MTRLFSNIASKLAPMAPKPSKTEVELYPTHSRDTRVLRPYSPPLDGPQYSPTFESRPYTPMFSQTSPHSSASFEIQIRTPLEFTYTMTPDTRCYSVSESFRTPTPLNLQESSLPSSPTDWGRSATFSGAMSPQLSIPDSFNPDLLKECKASIWIEIGQPRNIKYTVADPNVNSLVINSHENDSNSLLVNHQERHILPSKEICPICSPRLKGNCSMCKKRLYSLKLKGSLN